MSGLGRHVEHDPRSWGFPAVRAVTVKTALHKRRVPIFDQGDLGSCTGNAMAGALGTDPLRIHTPVTEKLAVKLYSLATQHDGVPGAYPPDDTGSSGLAVAKAAKSLGYIKGYSHAFGLDHALGALTLAPVIIGIGWYDSFDTPGPAGMLSISRNAQVRGGHELELIGLDTASKTVRGANSWSAEWGDRGYFTMKWSTFAQLLSEQGDVTVVH